MSAVRIAPQPEWVTIPEAARQLGVSPDTIRRRIRTGELKARGRGKTRQVRL
ncbi:MAG: DNA-binding protein [Alphaproteobacteria bacterium]|nr:MAG: DNA-binding protein [Alphaproteobacteria bacterium]